MVKVYAISKTVGGEERYFYSAPSSGGDISSILWVDDIELGSCVFELWDARIIQKRLISAAKGLGFNLELHIAEVRNESEFIRTIDESILEQFDPKNNESKPQTPPESGEES